MTTDVADFGTLCEIGNELLKHFDRADNPEAFDAAGAAETFRQWRAALRGAPEAEATLATWAGAVPRMTGPGSPFATAMNRLKTTLANNAQLIRQAVHSNDNTDLTEFRWKAFVEFLQGRSTHEVSDEGIGSVAALRDIGKLLGWMMAFLDEKPEFDAVVRPEFQTVADETRKLLQSPDLVRIEGAALLLRCDQDEFVLQSLFDPVTAKGFCDFVAPVLKKLHCTRSELKLTEPAKASVVRIVDTVRDEMPTRGHEEPLAPLPELWDVRIRREAAVAKQDSADHPVEAHKAATVKPMPPLEEDCLKAMKQLRAMSDRTRKTRDKIAKAIDQSYGASNIANAMASLGKRGYVDSRRGRPAKGTSGGCRLTESGVKALGQLKTGKR